MNNFDAIKKALVSAAEAAGIGEYEIYYQSVSSIDAETLKDELSSFSSGVSGGICFRCVVDGHMGYASTEVMEPSEMAALGRSPFATAFATVS